MNYIYFMRHGETDFNLHNKWMGCTDIPLNVRGEQQVLKVGRLLTKQGIQTIYCSPLARAKKSAEILSSILNIPNIFVLDELRERNYGELEGSQKTSEKRDRAENSPAIEPMADFSFRIKKALQSIRWSPSTLVVSHSGVYKCILSSCGGISEKAYEKLPNAAFVKLYQENVFPTLDPFS